MFNWSWFKKKELDERVVQFPDVQVIINREAYEKLKSFVLSVNTEITGLGIVKRKGDIFYIPEIFLLEQIVSSASAELDPVAIAKLMNRLIKEQRDPSKLKFWWHSHASMNPFWSVTDHNTCERFENKEFSISLVINKRLEYLCRLDLYQPLRITVDKIRLQIKGDYAFVDKDPQEEIKEKVREQSLSSYDETLCPGCQGLGMKNGLECPNCLGYGVALRNTEVF